MTTVLQWTRSGGRRYTGQPGDYLVQCEFGIDPTREWYVYKLVAKGVPALGLGYAESPAKAKRLAEQHAAKQRRDKPRSAARR